MYPEQLSYQQQHGKFRNLIQHELHFLQYMEMSLRYVLALVQQLHRDKLRHNWSRSWLRRLLHDQQ
jgi:hypothetical protein